MAASAKAKVWQLASLVLGQGRFGIPIWMPMHRRQGVGEITIRAGLKCVPRLTYTYLSGAESMRCLNRYSYISSLYRSRISKCGVGRWEAVPSALVITRSPSHINVAFVPHPCNTDEIAEGKAQPTNLFTTLKSTAIRTHRLKCGSRWRGTNAYRGGRQAMRYYVCGGCSLTSSAGLFLFSRVRAWSWAMESVKRVARL